MKRLITQWSNCGFTSFHVAVGQGRVTGTVTMCSLEGISQYCVFSFGLSQDWEKRVVTWMINMWRCLLGEPVPLGLCCDALPQLGGLFQAATGVGSLELKTLSLYEISRTIVDVGGRALGGTDIHVVLNHLQKRLKGYVRDPLLLSCPHLLQVGVVFRFYLSVTMSCALCLFLLFVYW